MEPCDRLAMLLAIVIGSVLGVMIVWGMNRGGRR